MENRTLAKANPAMMRSRTKYRSFLLPKITANTQILAKTPTTPPIEEIIANGFVIVLMGHILSNIIVYVYHCEVVVVVVVLVVTLQLDAIVF